MSQKKRRLAEGGSSAADVQESVKVLDVTNTFEGNDSRTSRSSQEIPIGEAIVPPYNGSKKLPLARLLYMDQPAGAKEDLVEEGESDDDLVEEVGASPPPSEYDHGDNFEDDPQLTQENLKKFLANI